MGTFGNNIPYTIKRLTDGGIIEKIHPCTYASNVELIDGTSIEASVSALKKVSITPSDKVNVSKIPDIITDIVDINGILSSGNMVSDIQVANIDTIPSMAVTLNKLVEDIGNGVGITPEQGALIAEIPQIKADLKTLEDYVATGGGESGLTPEQVANINKVPTLITDIATINTVLDSGNLVSDEDVVNIGSIPTMTSAIALLETAMGGGRGVTTEEANLLETLPAIDAMATSAHTIATTNEVDILALVSSLEVANNTIEGQARLIAELTNTLNTAVSNIEILMVR